MPNYANRQLWAVAPALCATQREGRHVAEGQGFRPTGLVQLTASPQDHGLAAGRFLDPKVPVSYPVESSVVMPCNVESFVVMPCEVV